MTSIDRSRALQIIWSDQGPPSKNAMAIGADWHGEGRLAVAAGNARCLQPASGEADAVHLTWT
jgi:hypothetical protein